MDNTAIDRDALEEKLHDPTASAIPLPFEFLNDITYNFSEELGRGGYGVVYKGVLRSGKIIAVKKLFESQVDDDQSQKEVTNLIGIKHKNIVRLVGYCVESRSEARKLPTGNYVLAHGTRSFLLCFEYLGNKSLDKHLSDASCGLDWNKRYEIIKGICSGLHFLHSEFHIVHLDLKPANILMDDAMMPKIADFGLSKLLGALKSRTIVSGNPVGTFGYMAPEYFMQGVVTPKADIFSFGVIIIEIITGVKEYPMSTVLYSQEFNENGSCQSTEISLKEYRENVIRKWRDVFKKEPKHMSPEIYTEQVEQCITTALECLNRDSTRRPTACDISRMLTREVTKLSSKAITKHNLAAKMNIILLSHLHPSIFNTTVQVRISRMWEYRGTSDDGDIKHLDLIIIYEKKNAKYVEIPPDAIPVLKPSLQEGMIITMRKFLVENAKPQFKVLDSPYMIKLNKRTEIAQIHPEPPTFPRYVYALTPIAELPEHVNKKDKFLDVIGQVVAVSNAALVRNAFGKQQMKRLVILRDESGNTVQVSLWGSRAVEFSGDLVFDVGQRDPVIIIFVGTLFKSYKGPPFLSGTSACHWYINEDIPHINEFYARPPPKVEPVEKLQLDTDKGIPSEIRHKTVLQLKDICPFEQAGEKFECTITITRLSPNQTWLYPACRACRTRSRLIGSTYKCNNDNCSCTEMFYRYKICLMGNDETYELQFVLFDNIAQQLIGKHIELLQSKYGMYDTPMEISSLVGQKYTFIVRISTRQSVKSRKDDPSFEVVSIVQQHGRQTNIPTIRANDPVTSSSSSFLSVPRAPLVPIRSNENTVIPPPQLKNENNPMEIEQTGDIIQETLTGSKRPYTTILSDPQNTTNDDQAPEKMNPIHHKKGKM